MTEAHLQAERMKAFHDTITPAMFRRVVHRLLAMAIDGDMDAAALLIRSLEWAIGQSIQPRNPAQEHRMRTIHTEEGTTHTQCREIFNDFTS